ncbi:MAG: hypothetical protein FWD46_06325, partial [Cystobacterineae bacterium]|nr:hypothetical protein [Cystobacterineae bacterium]
LLPPNPHPTSPTPPNPPNPPPRGKVTPPNRKPTSPGDAAEPLGDEVAPPGDAAAALGEVYHARIGFALPSMDLSRLVPKLLQGPAANLLCQGIAPEAELSLLRLGGLSLLGVPFEVSGEAAFALESAGLGRSVSVSNNYLGYLETSDNVEAHAGESSLQYFNKTLLERMVQAVDP